MQTQIESIERCVPADMAHNLRWRREITRIGFNSEEEGEQLREMCKQSFRFFCNGFLWTMDPRADESAKRPRAMPFILYPYQESSADRIEACIVNQEDLVISKSRDMGATWLILMVFLHRWLFHDFQHYLVASRGKDYVDMTGNQKTLFAKLDFAIEYLPSFLLPGRGRKMNRTFANLQNLENGNTINGESTTGNLARGDRRTAIMVDEFAAYEIQDGFDVLAATRDATGCRIFNSTIARQKGAFDNRLDDPNIRKIEMHWTAHPLKVVGLYKDESGKIRSPWYDAQCRRCATPQEIATELDMDRAAASSSFFDTTELNRVATSARVPLLVGDIGYEATGQFTGFNADGAGRASLWMLPDAAGKFPKDRTYIMGVDVAAGTGASNSCIQVIDRSTGEQVFEYANPFLRPDLLAPVAFAVGRWFCGSDEEAECIFENLGPGTTFHSSLRDLGYRRFYIRKTEGRTTKVQSEFIGVWTNKDEKVRQWGLFRKLLFDGVVTVRSRRCIEECRNVVYTPEGNVSHSGEKTADASGAKANHGDRASALMLASLPVIERGGRIANQPKLEQQPSPFKLRLDAMLAAKAAEADDY